MPLGHAPFMTATFDQNQLAYLDAIEKVNFTCPHHINDFLGKLNKSKTVAGSLCIN
jgi:hypothetical protein